MNPWMWFAADDHLSGHCNSRGKAGSVCLLATVPSPGWSSALMEGQPSRASGTSGIYHRTKSLSTRALLGILTWAVTAAGLFQFLNISYLQATRFFSSIIIRYLSSNGVPLKYFISCCRQRLGVIRQFSSRLAHFHRIYHQYWIHFNISYPLNNIYSLGILTEFQAELKKHFPR